MEKEMILNSIVERLLSVKSGKEIEAILDEIPDEVLVEVADIFAKTVQEKSDDIQEERRYSSR